jgi:hypothetical protein
MGAGRSVCKGTKIFLTAAAQRMQSFFQKFSLRSSRLCGNKKLTAEPQRTPSFFLKILCGLCAFAVKKN